MCCEGDGGKIITLTRPRGNGEGVGTNTANGVLNAHRGGGITVHNSVFKLPVVGESETVVAKRLGKVVESPRFLHRNDGVGDVDGGDSGEGVDK